MRTHAKTSKLQKHHAPQDYDFLMRLDSETDTVRQLLGSPVPVSQSHHDIQRCQEEYEVKETVAVCDSVSLIISRVLSSMLHITITS